MHLLTRLCSKILLGTGRSECDIYIECSPDPVGPPHYSPPIIFSIINMLWECMKTFFTRFCMESSVHGVKYLIQDKNIVSRCYWCFMLIFAIFCCFGFTEMLSSRFLDIPVRMIIKDKQALTEQMPLPSITFCSENPNPNTWYDQFLDNVTLPDNVDRKAALEAMRYVVSKVTPRFEHIPKSVESEPLELVDRILQYNNIEPRDFMERVSVPCHVLLQRCQLRGEVKPCGDLFKRVRGQCCTFTDNPEDFHSSGNLFGNSLIVLTSMMYAHAYFVVHEPESEPQISQSLFTMNNGFYIMFYIDPLRVEKSEEVHEIEEYSGECAHSDDRELAYFDGYEKSKCVTEWAINFSLALCDCIGTYFQAPERLICNFSQMSCLLQNPDLKNIRPIGQSAAPLNSEIAKAAARKGIEILDRCPNSCEKTMYRLNFKPRNFVPQYDFSGFLSDVDPKNTFAVHFNYESQFYTVQEFVLITDWITLLSNLGGVYGLFLGCSMVTMAEIVYFLWTTVVKKMCDSNRVYNDSNIN